MWSFRKAVTNAGLCWTAGIAALGDSCGGENIGGAARPDIKYSRTAAMVNSLA